MLKKVEIFQVFHSRSKNGLLSLAAARSGRTWLLLVLRWLDSYCVKIFMCCSWFWKLTKICESNSAKQNRYTVDSVIRMWHPLIKTVSLFWQFVASVISCLLCQEAGPCIKSSLIQLPRKICICCLSIAWIWTFCSEQSLLAIEGD